MPEPEKLDSLSLIRELVAIPGPPGQEVGIREAVARHVAALGFKSETDAKGNLIVRLPGAPRKPPRVVVTAHLDEIALMVVSVEADGVLRVSPLGGAYPWKWGEQPLHLLVRGEPIPVILSLGCIHTSSPASVAEQSRHGPLEWQQAWLFTGLPAHELERRGVRPGVRAVIAPERRGVIEFGEYVAAYFLDDRADLVAWLLALEELQGKSFEQGVAFVASAAEEVGGEGANYLLGRIRPEVCVALEIGPSVPESRFMPDAQPTIWVKDGYSTILADDMELLADICREIGQRPHWQPLSRGGSDASCAASLGGCARPITLGLPVENSHGLEIMHRGAPRQLARLLCAYLDRIS